MNPHRLPTPYRGAHAVLQAVRSLESRGARVTECAVSSGRRSVLAVEIGSPRAKSLSIAIAGLHPMQWAAVEALVAWLAALCDAPPEGRRVVAFPLVNVDGYAAVESDLVEGRRRLRTGNARGVDLNRNWPTSTGARHLRLSLSGRGSAPLSEPETRGVSEALDRALARGATDLRAMSLVGLGDRVVFARATGDATARGGRAARDCEARAVRTASVIGPPFRAAASARFGAGPFAAPELDYLNEAFHACALRLACGDPREHTRSAGAWSSPFDWFNPRDPSALITRANVALDDFLLAGRAPAG